MARRPDFSKKDQSEILKVLVEEFRLDWMDRDTWAAKRAQALEDMFHPMKGVKLYPWQGASNVVPPMVAKAVRTVWARLVGALLNIDPIIQAMPVNPRDAQSAEARQAYLNWQIRNEIPRFRKEISTWLLDLCNGGSSILLTWFEQFPEWTTEWFAVDNFEPILDQQGQFVEAVRKTDREVLDDIFEDLISASKSADDWIVKFLDEDGVEKKGEVFIDRKDEDVRDDQLSVLIKKMMMTRRVRISAEHAEDFLVPAASTGYQKEHAHHMTRKLWMHPDDIVNMAGRRGFHMLTKESADKLSMAVGHVISDEERSAQVLDTFTGIDSVWGVTGHRRGMLRIFEHYRPWKINGKTFDMIFYTLPILNKLLGWEYHATKFGHGRRPVTDGCFIPLTKRAEGAGVWHMVNPYQEEASVLINQMNDRGNLRNNPILLAEMNAGINAGSIRSRAPGDILWVRDVNRIRALDWQVEPYNEFPMLTQMFAFGEQAAGVGDLQSGVSPNRPNAPRTARGTLALIGEGNVTLDAHIMLVHEAFRELIFQIDGLNQQFTSPEQRFSITGKEELTITRKDFRARVRFFFSGNTSNTNPQVQQAVAQFLFEALAQHPFFTGEYVQMDQLALQGSWKLLNHFIKQHAPGKDANFVLGELETYLQAAQQAQQQQAQQQQELQQLQLQLAGQEAERDDLKVQTSAMKVAGDISDKKAGRQVNVLEMLNNSREAQVA